MLSDLLCRMCGELKLCNIFTDQRCFSVLLVRPPALLSEKRNSSGWTVGHIGFSSFALISFCWHYFLWFITCSNRLVNPISLSLELQSNYLWPGEQPHRRAFATDGTWVFHYREKPSWDGSRMVCQGFQNRQKRKWLSNVNIIKTKQVFIVRNQLDFWVFGKKGVQAW